MIDNETLLFPNGMGENISIDEHFLFGIYSGATECCLYSFLFTRHSLAVLSNS